MTSSVHVRLDTLLGSSEDGGIRTGADAGETRAACAASRWRVEPRSACGRTPGGWAIEDRPDTEMVSIISGRARITDAEGRAVDVGPGDVFVLPGWSRAVGRPRDRGEAVRDH